MNAFSDFDGLVVSFKWNRMSQQNKFIMKKLESIGDQSVRRTKWSQFFYPVMFRTGEVVFDVEVSRGSRNPRYESLRLF